MERQTVVQQEFRQQQQKFVYYLIALSVAAIAFAVTKTADYQIKWSQIPLAISVCCWSASIWMGFGNLKHSLHALYTNNALIDVEAGVHPDTREDRRLIDVGVKTLKKIIDDLSDNSASKMRRQERYFYLGILFFLSWHVTEMYLRSI